MRNLVVTRGLVLAAAGISTGGLITWSLGGLFAAVLNDVKPTDATVFGATAAALAVAVLASYLPARSAGRVDPMVVLRDA